ncbi:MAG TPA: hypothetical protein PKH69_05810 [Thiobacillaceae bacterium]|nr:hypothetical protein [Thiobacillaceae bacterium]
MNIGFCAYKVLADIAGIDWNGAETLQIVKEDGWARSSDRH